MDMVQPGLEILGPVSDPGKDTILSGLEILRSRDKPSVLEYCGIPVDKIPVLDEGERV